MTIEQKRLTEAREVHGKFWQPFLGECHWGNFHENYSTYREVSERISFPLFRPAFVRTAEKKMGFWESPMIRSSFFCDCTIDSAGYKVECV